MPNNLLHERNCQGLSQYAYDQMVNAFYGHVSRAGEIDLASAAPEAEASYERLLDMGYAAPVVEFLAKKAVLDIPEIKEQFVCLRPEDFGRYPNAEA
ncbi:MAG TPA: hypothetical protein VD706_02250 [Candidatus Saccharimonadales bacterium]|nr:hypothetical protein [Candidatus Saccharimonadales bacterium]